LKSNKAIFLSLPSFYSKRKNNIIKEGDYFILPKNIDSLQAVQKQWKSTYPDLLFDFLVMATNEIKLNYQLGDPLEHHILINNLIDDTLLFNIKKYYPQLDINKIKFELHGILDKLYRNIASELVIEEMKDMPLKVYGRGWDIFKDRKSKFHSFQEINSEFNYESQFHSNYGIIDIVPHKSSLHDRTLRSIAHNGAFLSNSAIIFLNTHGENYKDLFYSGRPDDLKEKAEAVIKNPSYHMQRSIYFGENHSKEFPFENFITFLIKLFK
jgi:hypothetical protein